MWLAASLLIAVPLSLFLIALAGANLWVTVSAQKHLVEKIEDASPADVILVLGAPVPNNTQPGPIVEDRLQCGLTLFRLGKAPRMIISGRTQSNGASEVVAMGNWLREQGMPPENLGVDGFAYRTIDSAINLHAFDTKPRKVLVCTQRFHLPRAVFLLKHQGFDVEGVVADGRVYRDKNKFAIRESLGRLRAVYETLAGVSPPCAHLRERENRLHCAEPDSPSNHQKRR
jgi:SanA protein